MFLTFTIFLLKYCFFCCFSHCRRLLPRSRRTILQENINQQKRMNQINENEKPILPNFIQQWLPKAPDTPSLSSYKKSQNSAITEISGDQSQGDDEWFVAFYYLFICFLCFKLFLFPKQFHYYYLLLLSISSYFFLVHTFLFFSGLKVSRNIKKEFGGQ